LILMEIGVSYMEITFDDTARARPQRALLRASIHYAMLFILGIVISPYIPISPNRVSVTFILVSSGICGYLYIIIVFLIEYSKRRFHRIEAWGKNPLMIYLVHSLLLACFVLPPLPGWYKEASPLLTIIQILIFLTILHYLARFFSRRGLILHI
jgi:fucose 4-O-acetylase-like acetyltransferase